MAEIKELELSGTAKVHNTSEMEPGVKFGKDLRVWRWSHIMSGTVIGDNVMVGEGVHIGPNVVIGNNVRIQNHALIYEGVVLEDNVFIGPAVNFTNIRKPRSAKPDKNFLKTIVRKGASIGANATIVCGNEIGENAMIGAGCVVHKSIPPNVTVVGNPARIVKAKRINL